MIGLDRAPPVEVQQSEYQRLLGLPFQLPLYGRMLELSDWARGWYAEHGQPWVLTRHAESFSADDGGLVVQGGQLDCPTLQERLQRGEAHALVLTAASAGPELEAEAQRLWEAEQPDAYFFLTVYGSAVVEHLVSAAGGRLCAWADPQGMAVLPHYSPGYPGWEITDQARLWSLIRSGVDESGIPLEVLESGMLRPKKSQLAVFGLTRRTDLVQRITELVPCAHCPLNGCAYRRTPYRAALHMAETTVQMQQAIQQIEGMTRPAPAPLSHDARYALNEKALKRWSQHRMEVDFRDDGRIVAVFHSEGSTCSDSGIPLAFDHTITLASREEGYRVEALTCVPSNRLDGHLRMCSYLEKGKEQLALIEGEKHFIGQPLNQVLTWLPPVLPDGCYCKQESRNHKWRNAFQTLHYALVQHEKNTAGNAD